MSTHPVPPDFAATQETNVRVSLAEHGKVLLTLDTGEMRADLLISPDMAEKVAEWLLEGARRARRIH